VKVSWLQEYSGDEKEFRSVALPPDGAEAYAGQLRAAGVPDVEVS
jgi:hypothetical protein